MSCGPSPSSVSFVSSGSWRVDYQGLCSQLLFCFTYKSSDLGKNRFVIGLGTPILFATASSTHSTRTQLLNELGEQKEEVGFIMLTPDRAEIKLVFTGINIDRLSEQTFMQLLFHRMITVPTSPNVIIWARSKSQLHRVIEIISVLWESTICTITSASCGRLGMESKSWPQHQPLQMVVPWLIARHSCCARFVSGLLLGVDVNLLNFTESHHLGGPWTEQREFGLLVLICANSPLTHDCSRPDVTRRQLA